jgi:hypothetical protein
VQADFAMGQEGERGEYGLCNAVLLSKPRSRFAVRWIALFNEVFDARIWSMHSVKYPLFAAALWPSDITVRATRVARARALSVLSPPAASWRLLVLQASLGQLAVRMAANVQ